jgi:hypothetical protein
MSVHISSANRRMTACRVREISKGKKCGCIGHHTDIRQSKIGAAGSRLMATMVPDSMMPAVYWTAPEVPTEIKGSGRTVFPVWPMSRSSATQ